MATETAAPAKKAGGKGWILWVLLGIVALGAGGALPWILGVSPHEPQPKKVETPKNKHAALPFDEVTVNLGEERLNRYLRVKLLVAVEEADSREVTEVLTKQKAFLKSWLISYLSDQTSQDVRQKVNVNRIRREICAQFNAMLYPNGEEKVVDILFDMFVVQ